jgi:hypothetical protein
MRGDAQKPHKRPAGRDQPRAKYSREWGRRERREEKISRTPHERQAPENPPFGVASCRHGEVKTQGFLERGETFVDGARREIHGPAGVQLIEPPYTWSVRTLVWEGRAGNRFPYPDRKALSQPQTRRN